MNRPVAQKTHVRVFCATLLAAGGLATGCTTSPEQPAPGSQLSAEVDEAATRVLTADRALFPLFETQHALAIVCAAHAYGIDPPDATDLAHVKTAYVWAECAERLPGHQMGDDINIPAVVDLTGTGRVSVPGEDIDYAPDMAHLFPDRVRHYFAAGLAPDAADLHRQVMLLLSTGPS